MHVSCPYCLNPAILMTGLDLYPHRPDLYQKKFWSCTPCGAYSGCHPRSKHSNGLTGDKPLGRLANAELRRLRMKAHALFDPKWEEGKLTRTQAYAWLANKLGIPVSQCHMGDFDESMCRKVIKVCVNGKKLLFTKK